MVDILHGWETRSDWMKYIGILGQEMFAYLGNVHVFVLGGSSISCDTVKTNHILLIRIIDSQSMQRCWCWWVYHRCWICLVAMVWQKPMRPSVDSFLLLPRQECQYGMLADMHNRPHKIQANTICVHEWCTKYLCCTDLVGSQDWQRCHQQMSPRLWPPVCHDWFVTGYPHIQVEGWQCFWVQMPGSPQYAQNWG